MPKKKNNCLKKDGIIKTVRTSTVSPMYNRLGLEIDFDIFHPLRIVFFVHLK